MTAWKTSSPLCKSPMVLVVSRDAKIAAAWELLFKQKGFCFILEQTPRHALQAARLLLPAVIILDLDLPKAERLALCRELRPLARNALLLLSPLNNAKEAAEYECAGVDERLSPTIRPAALIRKSLVWLTQ